MTAGDEQLVLHARNVEFDWAALPMHWLSRFAWFGAASTQ